MTKKENKENSSLVTYSKYSGLAFQMIAIILIGVFGGQKLDEYFNKNSLFTVILATLSVILAIYFAIKDFIKPQK
jgi:F0F1-type ATP synthase assembly protein I